METEASQTEDRAAEEQIENIEQEITPEQKRRDEENAERSRLGRKVKELESVLGDIGTIKEQLAALAPLLNRGEEQDGEALITAKDLPRYLEQREAEKAQNRSAYEKAYTASFVKVGVEDDDFDATWEEMLANHNVAHTGNPQHDAKINYLSAQNALLKKKGPKNPLQGKGKNVTGVNVPDTATGSSKAMPKLDPVAEEFVKRQGLSADWVNKALK